MKLATIAFFLLTGVPAVGQQAPQPPQALGPQAVTTLKDCQAAKSKLTALSGNFRTLSIVAIQEYALSMAGCVALDRKNMADYRPLIFELYTQSNARLAQFVEKTGRWDEFVRWDAEPRTDNEISHFGADDRQNAGRYSDDLHRQAHPLPSVSD